MRLIALLRGTGLFFTPSSSLAAHNKPTAFISSTPPGRSILSESSPSSSSSSSSSDTMLPPHKKNNQSTIISNNNEDAASELFLLDALMPPPDDMKHRVLLVTGGADNFMTILAHPSVGYVKAIDLNPLQQALAHLKLALACSLLSTDEVLDFMGYSSSSDKDNSDSTTTNKMDRQQVYVQLLEPHLPAVAQQIIREKLFDHEIKHGYNHFGGGIDTLFNIKLAAQGLDPESLWNGTCDMDKLKQVCESASTFISVDELLDAAGAAGKLPPPIIDNIIKNLHNENGITKMVMGHYRIAKDGVKSPCAAMTLLQKYIAPDLIPLWLEPETREVIRQKRHLVEFESSRLEELDHDENEPYHLVSPSNIFDFAPIEKTIEGVGDIVSKFLAPGGLFLFRRTFGSIAAIVEASDKVKMADNIDAKQLAEVDQAPFFYRNYDGIAALQHADQ